MTGAIPGQRRRRAWASASYDYLLIALGCARRTAPGRPLRKVKPGSVARDGRQDVLVGIVMSMLVVDAVFNEQWLMLKSSIDNEEGAPNDPEAWNAVDTPEKWIKAGQLRRVDLISRAAGGQPFIPAHADRLRDLFRDFVGLRNSVVHLTPDIWIETEEILHEDAEADGTWIATLSTWVATQDVAVPGRPIPPRGGPYRMSWGRTTALNAQHLHEVVKLTLATLHRAQCVFPFIPNGAVYAGKQLRSFKQLFNSLKPCAFDAELRTHWGL